MGVLQTRRGIFSTSVLGIREFGDLQVSEQSITIADTSKQ
jgi:hypothetical protein